MQVARDARRRAKTLALNALWRPSPKTPKLNWNLVNTGYFFVFLNSRSFIYLSIYFTSLSIYIINKAKENIISLFLKVGFVG